MAQASSPRVGPGDKLGRGFTLLELMVVLSIVGLASAALSLAWRDPSQADVAQEAQRLAALLETARAQSRASGLPVRWQPTETGFLFEGLQGQDLPQTWQHAGITAQVQLGEVLRLGPEPVLLPQAVWVWSRRSAALRWQVATDGVQPFTVQAARAATP
jgi:general secretion pathway protein H